MTFSSNGRKDEYDRFEQLKGEVWKYTKERY